MYSALNNFANLPDPDPNPNSDPDPNPNPNPDPDPIPNRNPNLIPQDLQKLGWHDTQVMPNPKPSMGDSTEHSVSVVALVSERQGENHSSLN